MLQRSIVETKQYVQTYASAKHDIDYIQVHVLTLVSDWSSSA